MSVFWLACQTPEGRIIGTGSGVSLLHKGEEYVVTANHVVEGCNYDPRVRQNNGWRKGRWETVATSKILDIAVLRTNARLHPRASYGSDKMTMGTLGRAIGFPLPDANLMELPDMWADMMGEMDIGGYGHPIPTQVPIAATHAPKRGAHYVGGYVNSGFSGGAIAVPTGEGWKIAGIITERGQVVKPLGDGQFLIEPTGLVRFVDIEAIRELIDRAKEETEDETGKEETLLETRGVSIKRIGPNEVRVHMKRNEMDWCGGGTPGEYAAFDPHPASQGCTESSPYQVVIKAWNGRKGEKSEWDIATVHLARNTEEAEKTVKLKWTDRTYSVSAAHTPGGYPWPQADFHLGEIDLSE